MKNADSNTLNRRESFYCWLGLIVIAYMAIAGAE